MAAYLAASGQPDLVPNIPFFPEFPKRLTIIPSPRMQPDRAPEFPDSIAKFPMLIHNRSRYAARNPGVRIDFYGTVNIGEQVDEWATVYTTEGVAFSHGRTIQWDGGEDFIIHGKWSRALPPLNLTGLNIGKEYLKMVITIAADGFSPKGWTVILEERSDDDE